MFVAIGRHLPAIIRGEVDPLRVLFEGKLAEDYYKDIFNSACCQGMNAYLDLLAHKDPGMKVLEIGAGTGGMTRQVLHALKVSSFKDDLARYSQYVFTDISGAYFEKAEADFAPSHQNLKFKTLNIEADLEEQGFEQGSYDVIIAGLVSTHYSCPT